MTGPSVRQIREDIEKYRESIAQDLAYHKTRVDRGLEPRCGIRLLAPGSAVVVANHPLGGTQHFAQFSLDSRDAERYAIASAAAAELEAYAAEVRSA